MDDNNNLNLINNLINGKDNIETVTIELDDNNKFDVQLRPLTSGELSKLQALERKSYNKTINMNDKDSNNELDLNMGAFTEANTEAMYKAVAWSMSFNGVNIAVDKVKAMDTGVPELIFNEVIRISKLTEADLIAVKSFRI